MMLPLPDRPGDDGGHGPRLLVATPTLDDPNFARTVVLLLDHDEDGAVGVVLNRPSTVAVADVLEDWAALIAPPRMVFGGGPVEPTAVVAIGQQRAGVAELFDTPPGSLRLVDLEENTVLASAELSRMRVFSGYAGWGAGQLEEEIHQGGWFELPAEADDVFTEDPDGLWHAVFARQEGTLRWYATYPEDPTWN